MLIGREFSASSLPLLPSPALEQPRIFLASRGALGACLVGASRTWTPACARSRRCADAVHFAPRRQRLCVGMSRRGRGAAGGGEAGAPSTRLYNLLAQHSWNEHTVRCQAVLSELELRQVERESAPPRLGRRPRTRPTREQAPLSLSPSCAPPPDALVHLDYPATRPRCASCRASAARPALPQLASSLISPPRQPASSLHQHPSPGHGERSTGRLRYARPLHPRPLRVAHSGRRRFGPVDQARGRHRRRRRHSEWASSSIGAATGPTRSSRSSRRTARTCGSSARSPRSRRRER